VEGHVNAFERDGGKATLQLDGLRLGFGLLGAFADDFNEVGFYVFEGEFLHERLDVDFLGFEVVRDASETIQGAELMELLV